MGRFGFAGFVVAYAIAALAWLLARRMRCSFRTTIVIAVALRVLFLFSTPALSADVYRYLWDGRTLAAGHNPYAALPTDPRVNHPEIPTLYPPHAEILFALFHNLLLWRLLLIAADVAALFLLDRRAAFAYATFPPLLFEGAWSGHIEVLAAMLLLYAWRRDDAAAAAFAVGTKIIPIAAVPLIFRRSATRGRFAMLFALVLFLPAVPFLISGHFMPGMRDYATRWVFNSPLYDAVFFVIQGTHVAEHLKNAWTAIKDPLHLEVLSHFVYYHLYADFLTRSILGLMAIGGIVIATRRRSMAGTIGALLICSPAIHPWYWLVLAPFASGIWLGLALCAPLSYLLYAGVSKWAVYALCYALPILLLPLSRRATSGAGWQSAASRSRTSRDTSPS